jgi:glycosyltransferase 2 family protein
LPASITLSSQSIKRGALTTLKLLIAFGIVAMMAHSGKLDFAKLNIFLQDPFIAALAVFHFAAAAIILSGYRWWSLLSKTALIVSKFRALLIHWIGLLFNSILPGALGGDIIKGLYIIRENSATPRAPILASILLDRIIGMTGLFLIAGIGCALQFNILIKNPAIHSVLLVVATLIAVTLSMLSMVFMRDQALERLRQTFIIGPILRIRVIKKILDTFRLYKRHPLTIIKCLLLSILIQSIAITYIWFIVQHLNPNQNVPFSGFIAILPIAILFTALPLAPGGIGVGHLAFDRMFAMIGISNGADVFNIYLIGTIALNMTGMIPYLLLKKPDFQLAREFELESNADTIPDPASVTATSNNKET